MVHWLAAAGKHFEPSQQFNKSERFDQVIVATGF